MKIEGAQPGRNSTEITLPRPDGMSMTLRVTALPLGFWSQVQEWIPFPRPPQKGFARGKDRELERDEEGRPIAAFDWQDSKYITEREYVGRLHNILCVAEALSDDPKVSFNVKPKRNRMREYVEAIMKEFEDFGFSDGDFGRLLKAVLFASRVTPERIGGAREDFLSGKDKAPSDTNPSESETDAPNST